MADEIRAIRFLLENESASGVFNVTSPEPLTYKAFGRVIGQVLGRPSLIPVPAFALRLVLGEVADTVLTGQRVVPQRLQEMGFTFRFPDARPALADLLK
jgi:NAD dependent epimerase/dehydratase family enzyme